MADHSSHHHDHEHGVIAEPQTKGIWKTFIILSVLTAFEFLIAFTLNAGFLKTSIFVLMTIVKAFYIVGEFMHLKHETKSLIWAIILPCIFVVWLMLALLMEGGFIYIAK
ncbi:cytochrome C oxidase subunit IV family protein [Larkinella arboricola]|uniref:Caa(3)-type oxidase subunit IV n=1 Tax=Larkinella arboricola TaxID=643671 RepID=A0A327X509_LARAB|nr:cytochrome C oxidase subunit IV family protein [Larkinella arboricola]RAK02180.1 caa(3)-type oxidase subunit IV [Larkinella arboricola]